MLRRIWAMTQKDLIQILRDRATLVILMLAPLLQLTLYSAAIHTDVKHIPMVVADQSMSNESRTYLAALVDSEYFDIVASVSGQAGLMKAIDSGQASLGILIPPDFGAQIKNGHADVLMLVDGSDSFTTKSAYSTANAISESYAISLIRQSVTPLAMDIRILYNPDLKELWFLMPAMIAMLMQGLTLNLTALSVVREREVGTIEALLVTPIRPVELMLGKTIPNLLVASVCMVLILLTGTLIFGVPFLGNPWLFMGLCILFAFSGLALGLAISVVSQTQMQAQLLSTLFNLSAMFLAGFLFPAYALPVVLRTIGYIFPLTYFIPIARGSTAKGWGSARCGGRSRASARCSSRSSSPLPASSAKVWTDRNPAMPQSLQRLTALTRKETTQLLRDRRGLSLFLGLALLQLFLYAYAVNTSVYHIPLAVADQSRDRKSREFLQALVNSQYFDITLQLQSEAEVIDAIDRGEVKAGLVIPARFATATDRGMATVLMLLDGSDSASVSSGFSAASLLGQNYALQLNLEQLSRKGKALTAAAAGASSLPIITSTRVLYNPDMIDTWFLLPGLVGLILQTLAVQQAALIVVRERELGTIEQILATPTRPLELVMSKMIPLLVLCMLAMGVAVAIGIFWFGVPFQGNLFSISGSRCSSLRRAWAWDC